MIVDSLCWLNLIKWNKDIVIEAIESGIDCILCGYDDMSKIKELGIVNVAAQNSIEFIEIKNKSDEIKAAELLKTKTVIVKTTDWNIIPIENLIAASSERLFTVVKNKDEALLATQIMERGVSIVIETEQPGVIASILKAVKSQSIEHFNLEMLSVTSINQIGICDRVCVDLCSNLPIGSGLLVGNSSMGSFLVHAENIENNYAATRPFRVNAGAVHAYIKVPDNKTRYLTELKSGDPVLAVNFKGEAVTEYVGRIKIEKRPMFNITAKDKLGSEYSIILQNAETIRLVSSNGTPISIVSLNIGDEIMGCIEKSARHFGISIDESISEN